jgi:ABC-type nickel/cobalt efflux system permease component RcnA
MSQFVRFNTIIAVFCFAASVAAAHPVPKDTHDRTITVRLQKAETPDQLKVRIEYRLEVDEFTVEASDMKPFEKSIVNYRGEEMKFYAEFTDIYAPIFAGNIILKANSKTIEDLRCVARHATLNDENGKGLGHLRCDFVFEKTFDADPQQKLDFFFWEKNYYLQEGQVTLSFVNASGRVIEAKWEPDDAFRKRAKEQPEPGDDDKLRSIRVTLAPLAAVEAPVTGVPAVAPPRESQADWFDLRRLIQNTNYGFWLIMLMAFVFGAAHAMTPGHGKTLVAAYLVGERGTVWHAVYLGIVTTLTHTGIVIAIAIVLTFLPQEAQQSFKQWIEHGLGLVVGLIVVAMGFWLFLQRVAGRADHIHVGGGHHHHHGPSVANASGSDRVRAGLSWWGITVLGMTGGIIPCWDAVGVLFWAVGTKEMWLVLPAVLVFSAGLAIVLVIIGILVVQVPRFVESRYGNGRLLNALPIVSSILVTLMGLWLCYEGTRGM